MILLRRFAQKISVFRSGSRPVRRGVPARLSGNPLPNQGREVPFHKRKAQFSAAFSAACGVNAGSITYTANKGGNDDDDDDDELLEVLLAEEDVEGPQVNSGGVEWGARALDVAQRLLSESGDLGLYSYRAVPATKYLDIRLDKLSDCFGSPTLDEIATFSHSLNAALEVELGPEAGEIEITVSSPGAERAVRFPEELPRFADLPMRVEFESSAAETSIQVLAFVALDLEAGLTEWVIADVRANLADKGRPLSRKRRDQVLQIPVAALRRVNLHVDI